MYSLLLRRSPPADNCGTQEHKRTGGTKTHSSGSCAVCGVALCLLCPPCAGDRRSLPVPRTNGCRHVRAALPWRTTEATLRHPERREEPSCPTSPSTPRVPVPDVRTRYRTRCNPNPVPAPAPVPRELGARRHLNHRRRLGPAGQHSRRDRKSRRRPACSWPACELNQTGRRSSQCLHASPRVGPGARSPVGIRDAAQASDEASVGMGCPYRSICINWPT